MRKLLVLFGLLVGLAATGHAQGIRFDSQVTQQGTIGSTSNAVVIPPSPVIKFCNAPAIGSPCTNLATTYTDVTLSAACPTSSQIVLAGTSSCVSSPDAQNNWGVWVPVGQYAYTITVGSTTTGPYPVTAGTVSPVALVATPFSATPNFAYVAGSQETSFSLQLTGNVTSSTISGAFLAGSDAQIIFCQDATGGRTFSFPSSFLNVPASIATSPNACTAGTWVYCGSSGGAACPANQWQNTNLTYGVVALSTDNTFTNNNRFKGPDPWIDVTAYATGIGSAQNTTCSITGGLVSLACSSALDFANTNTIAVFGAGPATALSAPTGLQVNQASPILAYTATASVTANVATLTLPLGGVSASWNGFGFTNGGTINVAGFLGADAYFNGTYTISSLSGGSITFPLTHANATATSNGSVTQVTPGATTYTYQVAAVDGLGGISAPSSAVTTTTSYASLGLTTFNQLTWLPVPNAVMYVIYGRSGSLTYIATVGQSFNTWPTVNFNDYGQNTGSVPYVPAAVPSVATNQALLAKILSGGGTTSLTLDTAATATVVNSRTQHDATAAINSATADAMALGGAFGGGVFFPPNGTYNFFKLNLATTNNGYLTLKVAGTLSPMAPLIENNFFLSIIGEPNGNGILANFGKKPMAQVNAGGLNPVIRANNTSSFYCENIYLANVFGDGFLLDNATDSTFNNCGSDNSSLAIGSPIKMLGSFGLYVNSGSYIYDANYPGAQEPAGPAIYLGVTYGGDPSRLVKINDSFFNHAGLRMQDVGPGSQAGCHNQIEIDNLLEEDRGNMVYANNAGVCGLSLWNDAVSDNPPSPPAINSLLSVAQNGSIADVSLMNTSSGSLFYVTPLNNSSICGVTYSGNAGISTMNTPFVGSSCSMLFRNKTFTRFINNTFFESRFNTDLGVSMPPPAGLNPTAAAGAGLANGTYFYVITATDAGLGTTAETNPSDEVSVTLTGGNGQVNLTWLPPPGATNIKLYRGTASLGENVLVTTLAGSAGSFTDTGGGAGGNPPTFSGGYATWAWFGWNGSRNWWWNPPNNQGFCTESPTVKFDVECAGAAKFGNGAISPASFRSSLALADQGTVCTNGELALSAGWQSTGSATVTAVVGNGQTCSWTITTGTTTAANPTVTDTLTNALPSASTVCELNIHGGTHTAAAGEGFQQTTLSATAPIFTFNGTPTAGGTTYFVTRRCGP
jgi:hypothetical protein